LWEKAVKKLPEKVKNIFERRRPEGFSNGKMKKLKAAEKNSVERSSEKHF